MKAVDGVSLEVAPGECLGLVGESGCGKSSLALAVMGLVPPTHGRIALDGQEIAERDRLMNFQASAATVEGLSARLKVVDERLDTIQLEWDPRPAVTVVMASEGYPGHYERDRVINNLEEAERMPDVKVFHAGTALRTDALMGRDGRIVTDGGRVLNVTALGATLADAQSRAYEAVRAIRFTGAWYRHDIAERALRSRR